MPRRAGLTLSKRTVDGLSAEGGDTVFWDRDVPGFGIRVYPSGRKIYVVQSRGPDGLKRVSLGRHGELTPGRARRRAVAAIGRIKRGEDAKPAPREAELTVAGLAERYMEAHVRVNCNAHTRGIYRGSLKNHILPALGDEDGLAGEPGGRGGAALPPPGDAAGGEPGADGPVEDVLAGRGVGRGAAGQQPVPLRGALPGGEAGALSERGRVPAGGAGAAPAGGSRPGRGARGGGAQAGDADRLPVGRGAEAAGGTMSTARPASCGCSTRRRGRGWWF